MDQSPTPYHLGFLLGPRINAGGRIGAADLGARLLATDDPHEAAELAARLDMLNTERRAIEQAVRDAALAQAEARGIEAPLVWASDDGWHPGVVGIVAARLKEATHRPAVVIGFEGDIGKGSARSVAGVDLGSAIHRLAAEGLIEKGGGHRMAAGLTLTRAQLAPAMERLSELLARQGAGATGPRDLPIDALLMPSAVTAELLTEIDRAGPFGQGAPAPRFAFAAMMVYSARAMGESHLRLLVGDLTGPRLETVAFNATTGPLAPLLRPGTRLHLAGKVELNTWGGRTTPQLKLDDAAPAS